MTTQRARAGGGKKTREPQGITPDMILDTTLDIVEREGPDAVTMRRVSGELGVAPPTIYWHVGNKDELLSRVLDRMEDSLAEVRPRGSTPHARIKSIMMGVRRELDRHPALTSLAWATGRASTLYIQSQRALVDELQRADLRPRDIGFALHNLLTFNACFFYVEKLLVPPGADTYHYAGPDALASEGELDPELAKAISADANIGKIFEFQLDALIARLLTLGD